MRQWLMALPCLICAAHAAPAASLHGFDYFVGEWTCKGVFPASGRTIASTMRYERDLDGQALVKHHADTSPPAAYRALEAWGYDAKAGRFNAAVLDSSGGVRRFDSTGWQGDVLTWSSAADVAPAQRFVYVRKDAGHYRVDWQVARDGAHFVVGDTLTCARKRG